MSIEYFDEKVLEDKERDYEIVKDFRNLSYHFKKIDNGDYFFCEISGERLNSYEMKALLKLDEQKGFLSASEKEIFNYVIHRLAQTQSYYKILNDFDLFFLHLSESSFKIFYGENQVKFERKGFKLRINLSFNDDGNVLFNLLDEGEFIFGLDKAFFFKEKVIYSLSEEISVDFYREIAQGHKVFSIDSFFSLKNSYLDKLKRIYDVEIEKEVLDLANLNLEEKIAPLVLEVDKTAHFVVAELKYKVGDERFKVEDFVYVDTINWLDKKRLIRIVKENGKLVKYLSDENLSEDIIGEIFEGTRIRFRQYMKSPFRIVLPMYQLNNFVNLVIPRAEKFIEVDYRSGEKIKIRKGSVGFDIDVNFSLEGDLFEFEVKFKIGEEYFGLDFIKALMEKSRKFVELKNGTTIDVENIRDISKWLEFLKSFDFSLSKKKYVGTTLSALELDKFLEDFGEKNIKSNDEYKKLISELSLRKPVEEITIPEGVANILRDYQKEGIYWLYFLKKYGFGGILADEMGLGKTIQALTILAMEKDGTSIVVCPKTLLYNWENEVNKYFPDLRVMVIDGDNEKRKTLIEEIGNYDVVITSYSMLQKDYENYLEYEFNYAVLDEAHFVKNIKTLSAKAVRLIRKKNIVLLTGTPLENNLEELYGTFDLIMPNYLGAKSDFSKDFVSKIERNNMIALELLQAKIRPFILRRTKKEVLKELPDKQERIVYSEMTNKQVGIYNEILNQVKKQAYELVKSQGFDKSRIQILSALLKLRQVCNHPALLDKSFLNEEEISGKFNQFLELLSEVIDNGEKVLVFSQFTSMLDIFEKEIHESGIEYLRLDGSTKNRQELVDKFNGDDTIKVFLISLKAGGVGLNLTSASSVFLYDPWWNPMVEQQAQDRAHRIGQLNTVNVYKFITKGSIEEKILKLQQRKGNLFENLVVEDKGFVKKLEWEDLMELFD